MMEPINKKLVLKKSKSLWQSVVDGDIDSVREALIRNPDAINERYRYGFTPLIRACISEYWDIAKVLLESPNIDINATANSGRSALIYVCWHGGAEFLLQLLEHLQLDINHTDNYGESALQWAAQRGHHLCMKILLAHGAICSDDWRDWDLFGSEEEENNETRRILRERRSLLPEFTIFRN